YAGRVVDDAALTAAVPPPGQERVHRGRGGEPQEAEVVDAAEEDVQLAPPAARVRPLGEVRRDERLRGVEPREKWIERRVDADVGVEEHELPVAAREEPAEEARPHPPA